jgi:hypothetical protein
MTGTSASASSVMFISKGNYGYRLELFFDTVKRIKEIFI